MRNDGMQGSAAVHVCHLSMLLALRQVVYALTEDPFGCIHCIGIMQQKLLIAE